LHGGTSRWWGRARRRNSRAGRSWWGLFARSQEERAAGGDGFDKCVEAVLVGSRHIDNLIHCAAVIVLQSATEGISQQFFGQTAGKFLFAAAEDRDKFFGRAEHLACGKFA